MCGLFRLFMYLMILWWVLVYVLLLVSYDNVFRFYRMHNSELRNIIVKYPLSSRFYSSVEREEEYVNRGCCFSLLNCWSGLSTGFSCVLVLFLFMAPFLYAISATEDLVPRPRLRLFWRVENRVRHYLHTHEWFERCREAWLCALDPSRNHRQSPRLRTRTNNIEYH